MAVHSFDKDPDHIAVDKVLSYARDRLLMDPLPLDGPQSEEYLESAAGQTVTAAGLGADRAMELFEHTLAPACLSTDHPRYLSFIPCAPTREAAAFDVVVGASSIYGGSWLEGAGAVYAENQALRWIADLAGLPEEAGGVFVPGGTVGNLSALVVARTPPGERGRAGPGARPWRIAATDNAHSSVVSMAAVMDAEVCGVPSTTAAAHRARAAPHARGVRPRDVLRRRRDERHDELRRRRRPRVGGRGVRGVRPLVPRRRRLRGRGLAAPSVRHLSPASSGPTPSSSTRTSGSSRRSTAAR